MSSPKSAKKRRLPAEATPIGKKTKKEPESEVESEAEKEPSPEPEKRRSTRKVPPKPPLPPLPTKTPTKVKAAPEKESHNEEQTAKKDNASKATSSASAKVQKSEENLSTVLQRQMDNTDTPANQSKKTEKLPALDDPAAIDDFFWRKHGLDKLGKSEDSRRNQKAEVSSEAITPSDVSKEMSVKEALAMRFQNYRVRISKPRRGFTIQDYLEREQNKILQAQAEATASESNGVPTEAATPDQCAEPTEPSASSSSHNTPSTSLRFLLDAVAKEGNNELSMSSFTSDAFLQQLREQLNDSGNSGADDRITDPAFEQFDVDQIKSMSAILYDLGVHPSKNHDATGVVYGSINSYPYPPFWAQHHEVSKGYKGGYYIKGVKYVQLASFIANDQLKVNLHQKLRLKCEGMTLEISFYDLLAANGVVIRDPNHCKDIQWVLFTSVFLIHTGIVEQLLSNYGIFEARSTGTIPLSNELPPFACYRLHYFKLAMGKVVGGANEIYDVLQGQQANNGELSASLLQSCPLSVRDRALVIAHFDAGATRFQVPIETVQEIVFNRLAVLRQRNQLYLDEEFPNNYSESPSPPTRDSVSPRMSKTSPLAASDAVDTKTPVSNGGRVSDLVKRQRMKNRTIRRTSFVALNVMVWKFFKECRDNSVQLNGKMLKDHAMMIARDLGLDAFKGSEGWLDAFKRRHKIDLRLMTGIPVAYDENHEEGAEEEMEQADSILGMDEVFPAVNYRPIRVPYSRESHTPLDVPSTSSGTTDELLKCVEQATSQQSAMVNISDGNPLDLNAILNSFATNHTNGAIDGLVTENHYRHDHHHHPSTSKTSQRVLDENGFIASVVKSAAVRVPDKEVSYALDTIRSFVLANDPSIMPALLALQMKLADISEMPKLNGECQQNGTAEVLNF